MLAAFLFLAAGAARAQVLETGSLRSFILGDEPAAAYDNWLSHTVEGLADSGGFNHHIPPELDPQTDGFGHFELISEADAPAQRLLWRDVFTHLWNDEPAEAQALLDDNAIPYELVYFTDTETGRTYRMLRELLNPAYVDTGYYAGPEDDVTGSFDRGWGLFILNPDAALSWAQAQAAHVNDDFISVPLVADLFLDGDLAALAVHGAGREVLWEEGQDYNNARSLSDPTRNGNLPFHWFTEFFVDTTRAQGERDLTIQFHSYDSESHAGEPTIQVSCGPADGFANRPSRDYSGLGYDWVNFAPAVVVPTGFSMPGQAEVTVGDYFAVWHATGLVHLESGTPIPTNVQLPGYGNSPQMSVAASGYNRFEAFDRWLHLEFDELPYAIEDAGYGELDFYDGEIPPAETNWQAMLAYYDAAAGSLIDYMIDVENPVDVDSPTTPGGLEVLYAGDSFVELTWSELSLDPNFATYEVYYGTDAEIDTTDEIWSSVDHGNLAGQNISYTSVAGLDQGLDYGFRLRGVDLFGQASELSEMVRAVTNEGNQPPLPFSLISPADGDTCFTLDTTLVWEATTDPDPYDTPHYDVWLDTLPDLSTGWIPEDADSIAETSFEVTSLLNRVTYYWTVRATDRNTDGTWANEINSLVTWHPLPPAPFALAEPMDRTTLWDTTSATLRWHATVSQEDPEDEIGYIVIRDVDGDFTEGADTTFTADTSLAVDELTINETYWWKVLAYDSQDTTTCDATWKFYLWDQPPPGYELLAPEDGEQIDDDTVAVSWSVPEDPSFASSQRRGPTAGERNRLLQLSRRHARAEKGAGTHAGDGWASVRNQGGPDDFGHLWIDNEQPGGPPYDWIEISEIGTLSDVSEIDDGTQVVALPFQFSYFGNIHTSVVISSNGNIHFGEPDGDWHHYTIPSPEGPAGIVAPWWLDLRPNVQGDVYYHGNADRFVVQWENCREYNNADWLYTFEVVLSATGRIRFFYKEMTGGLEHATVGIENLAEDDGLLVAYNAPWVADRIAAMFTFDDYLYEVHWSAHEDFTDLSSVYTFDTEYEVGDVILEELLHSSEIDELPDDLTVYWRVRTLSLYSRQVWADPGEAGLTFMVYLQEPPSTFALLAPEDGDTLSAAQAEAAQFAWQESEDPDPGETALYTLDIAVTIGDSVDTTLAVSGIEQTELTLDLPAMLGVEDWEQGWDVTWEAAAVSGADTVACEQSFAFHVAPSLSVPENRFAGIPADWSLAGVYPNPFNSTATVVLGVPAPSTVELRVYNVAGRRVETTRLAARAAGYHTVTLDGTRLASGIYFIRATVPGRFDEVRKIALVR